MINDQSLLQVSCPMPLTNHRHLLLAHGGGGKLSKELLDKLIVPAFTNPSLESAHDAAVLANPNARVAMTTDSFVVRPIFFAGGDIGSLSIHGTVNDLAMVGARPLYISVAFILEEGLSMERLWRVLQSMRRAADSAGVRIVTGDTKVVDRGKGDEIFITTAGIGVIEQEMTIAPTRIAVGDQIIVSGDLGRHGMAILSAREGLQFESAIESDSAPLNGLVAKLLAAKVKIHCLRDLTRGGLVSALNELAMASGHVFNIEEKAVPVRDDVRGACEILGLDPLSVANEGRFVLLVDRKDVDRVLGILRADPLGENATLIGEVTEKGNPRVTMVSRMGVVRILDMLSGEQLPRIC